MKKPGVRRRDATPLDLDAFRRDLIDAGRHAAPSATQIEATWASLAAAASLPPAGVGHGGQQVPSFEHATTGAGGTTGAPGAAIGAHGAAKVVGGVVGGVKALALTNTAGTKLASAIVAGLAIAGGGISAFVLSDRTPQVEAPAVVVAVPAPTLAPTPRSAEAITHAEDTPPQSMHAPPTTAPARMAPPTTAPARMAPPTTAPARETAPPAPALDLGAPAASASLAPSESGAAFAPLAAEAAAVRDARRALHGGAPQEALAILRDAEVRFGAGSFDQEREALAIMALARTGKRAEAERDAARFFARYPTSPHSAAVRRALSP